MKKQIEELKELPNGSMILKRACIRLEDAIGEDYPYQRCVTKGAVLAVARELLTNTALPIIESLQEENKKLRKACELSLGAIGYNAEYASATSRIECDKAKREDIAILYDDKGRNEKQLESAFYTLQKALKETEAV